jgi:hypothetical protein
VTVEATPAGSEVLAMSDEEVMNMTAPPEAPADAGAEVEEKVEDKDKVVDPEPGKEPAGDEDDKSGAEVEDSEKPSAADDKAKDEGTDKVEDKAGEEKTPAEDTAGKDKAPEGADKDQKEKKPEASPTGSKEGVVAEPTNEQAVAFYKQIMAPFKANGKMIQLKDPSEAIQLMQMGANYTRKLQDIQPHRKVLLMLQNNDLLDEGKLSYLIDLDKKNPEAIKKLIKDAGIDPMDIDTSSEPTYLEGNHRVSDEEAGFRQVLDEMVSTQSGKETVQLINTDWDQASKEVLWQSPEIMSIIHEQRESGVYDLITTELDRQKTLGKIPPNTPFLQAYKTVGDELAAAGAFGSLGTEQKEPAVVTTTVAAPKSAVTNGDKASAASPTRTTTRKAEKLVNPLAMSDDEFLSQMANRL